MKINMKIVKQVGGIIASVAVGVVVHNIIGSTMPVSTNKINKVLVGVGGMVLSSMIGEKASEHAEVMIDKTVEQVKGIVDNIEDLKAI